ncbi:MAG: hypothetical protein AB1490_09415 [Pseudomonadota bacterium]
MAESADPPLVLRCRRNEREVAATWTLGPDALERTEGNGLTKKMAYGEVKELRLLYDPARAAPNRFRCDLNSVAGHRVSLMSKSFVTPGVYDDRSSGYTPFVRELIQRVGTAAPACKFYAGQTSWSFFGGHALGLIGVLVIAHLAARFGGLPPNAALILKIVMAAAYLAIAALSAKRRRPRSFKAQSIPPDMLP